MANRIDSHFNDFGGIDSRTNQAVQNPKTARDGRNFEYRTESAFNDFDFLSKRRGFQHKTSANGASNGLIKYVYRDLTTGAQRVEFLGADGTGVLYRRVTNNLTITKALSAASFFSVFYDETVSLWRFVILDSNKTQLGTVTFNATVTIASLVTSLNALSIPGITFSGASTDLAYLIDVAFEKPLPTGVNNLPVYSWQQVVTPNSSGVLFDYIASGAWQNNPEFNGISYINLNNSIYMTDGGFPIKYDGYAAYRAGMPRTPIARQETTNYNGVEFAVVSTGSGDPIFADGSRHFIMRLAYRDPNGSEVLGPIQDINQSYYRPSNPGYGSHRLTFTTGNNALQVTPAEIKHEDKFPVYSCKINNSGGHALTGSGPFVLNVISGHNILPGMCLRISCPPAVAGSTSRKIYMSVSSNIATYFFYSLVSTVTATSITLTSPIPTGTLNIADGTLIQGCYVPPEFVGKTNESTVVGANAQSISLFGAAYILYTTKNSAPFTGPYYQLGAIPVPHNATHASGSSFRIGLVSGDADLTLLLDEEERGEQLPRACRYLTSWQGQLVQAGRPYAASSIVDDYYPTAFFAPNANGRFGTRSVVDVVFDEYTEAHLCDEQSIYWNDPLFPEGFPQSGLFEESFETPIADKVSGMGESKDALFVFKDRSMFILNGELATGNIRKERYEVDIGCASHNSIVSVRGGLMWLDATHGFCAVIANQMPRIIGFPVQDWQKSNKFKVPTDQLQYATARGVNDLIGDKYLCYVRRSSGDLIFAYDYADNRNCWYIWSGLDARGGFVYDEDSVWFAGSLNLWRQKNTGSRYDFSDHTSSVPMVFKSAWINFKNFSIDKKWVQLVIHSSRRGFGLLVSQYYNYIDTKEGEIQLDFNLGANWSPKRTVSLNKLKSLSFSAGFENNIINQDMALSGWELQYSAEYDKGEAKS